MIQVGHAEIDITPAGEVDLSGYVGREQPSMGVRDPITCSALALSDGLRRAVIISCDLIGLTEESIDAVRALVSDRAGAPEPFVLVSCTHTHSAPATVELLGCGAIQREYLAELVPNMARCAMRALSSMAPATLRWGTSQCELGINRRNADGPTPDRTLMALEVETDEDKCVLVRYACHCAVLDGDNREVSADLAGGCRDALADRVGASTVVYLTGACGDVNPAGRGEIGPEEAGAELADAAVVALRAAEPLPDGSRLAYNEISVLLPIAVPPVTQLLADAQREHDLHLECTYAGDSVGRRIHAVREAWARQLAVSAENGTVPEGVPLRVSRLSIGPLTLVGLSAEAFNYFERMVRQAHGDAIFIVGYANGLLGYLPSPEAFPEGGYEVEDAHKFYGGLPLSPEAPAVAMAAIDRVLWT